MKRSGLPIVFVITCAYCHQRKQPAKGLSMERWLCADCFAKIGGPPLHSDPAVMP